MRLPTHNGAVMMSLHKALAWINRHTLAGIKAGSDRDRFLDIWMVEVDGRIFARSWGLSERSWYSAFLQHGAGEIRCGEDTFAITARVPADLQELTSRIDQAYLDKYNHGDNAVYAQGIVRPEHAACTMEFIPQ